MKADKVVLRVFGGEAAIGVVVAATPETVAIHSPDQFDLSAAGNASLFPIGFPRADVFEYDQCAVAVVADRPIKWSALRAYKS
jgi:hypothetical protein